MVLMADELESSLRPAFRWKENLLNAVVLKHTRHKPTTGRSCERCVRNFKQNTVCIETQKARFSRLLTSMEVQLRVELFPVFTFKL